MYGGKRRGKRRQFKPKRAKRPLWKNKKRQIVQYFKRTEYISNWKVIPAVTGAHIVQTFQLASIPNSTDFTNLYDAYQIKACKMSIIPRTNVAEFGGNSTTYQIHSVLDYDNATPLTTLNDYVQFESYKTSNPFRQHNRYLVPAMEQGVVNATGVVVPAVQKKRQWLDCQFPTIPHNSVKILIDNSSPADVHFDMKITYYLAMKQVK